MLLRMILLSQARLFPLRPQPAPSGSRAAAAPPRGGRSEAEPPGKLPVPPHRAGAGARRQRGRAAPAAPRGRSRARRARGSQGLALTVAGALGERQRAKCGVRAGARSPGRRAAGPERCCRCAGGARPAVGSQRGYFLLPGTFACGGQRGQRASGGRPRAGGCTAVPGERWGRGCGGVSGVSPAGLPQSQHREESEPPLKVTCYMKPC